ncbi:MAG: GNAT family N-acetyltransferase [Flavobacteriales bacterium]|nr:GNAT family N-acetyltransferase [Flavobacteriales bacterium]
MIRSFQSTDTEKLVELLRLNTPRFFDQSEEKDFIDYLKLHAKNYLVIEHEGVVIGGGGINYGFDSGKTARISWDVIHPDFQGKGIGTKLTNYRINEVKKHSEINMLVVRTTQLVFEFYQKLGFVLEKKEKDYWSEGYDLYLMKMDLNKDNAQD